MTVRALLVVLAFLGPLEEVDFALQRAAQEARRPALEAPARFLSDKLGRPLVVTSTLLAMCLIQGTPGIATARLAVLTLIPVNLVVDGLKRLTFRTRPDGERKRSNASFPSSHAANAFALMAVFARRWPRAAPALWLLAALVGYSRIYLNRHYASDVVVGAAIGIFFAWAVHRWWTHREQARARESQPVVGAP